ncbi:HD family phosphohydrolase, partial [Bacillus pumilus]|uniref:HD family phosphohydrolase n=3 Tax=Bacillaceae TaxID=186817 RepID=UPI003AA8EDB9
MSKKEPQKMERSRYLNVLLYAGLAAILFVVLFFHVKPESLDLDLFSVSEQTIYSPSTVDDQEATEEKKQEATDQVEDQYTLKKAYSDNRVDLISSLFEAIKEEKKAADEKENPPSDKEMVKRVKEKLTSDMQEAVSDQSIKALLQASEENLSFTKDSIITVVNSLMSKEITAAKLQEEKKQVKTELENNSIPSKYLNAAKEIGEFAIIPNYVFDPVATEKKRQEAADNIQPVQIKQGQILVEEGELIDREVYRKLELTGLLNSSNLIKPVSGLMILIGLFLAAIIHSLETRKKSLVHKNKSLLLYSLIFTIILVIMEVFSLFQETKYTTIGYVVPVALGTMLIKLLINERLAIFSGLVFALCGSMMFNQGVTGVFNYVICAYYLVSGMAGILFLRKHNARSKILQAGLSVALVNVLAVLSITLIQNSSPSGLEIGVNLMMAIVSGFASSILVIGLMPVFESMFGILSTMKLIELSNPNHPLLKKILTETPGTYHHSVMVANLADAACEAVGANGLLARVGAYYHDIGKTKRPQYFIENQMNID